MTQGSEKAKRRQERALAKEKVKQYICIICPNCCELETDGSEVNGARCEKGETFARQEMIQPLRVITTTVRCETSQGRKMVPVKTYAPVPLSRILEIMKEIRAIRLTEVPPLGSRIRVSHPDEPVELIVTGE